MKLAIEPKKKKCKGTGPARGYGCGTMTYHRHYGLCKASCYPDWLLNSELGKIKMQKSILKVTKPRKELERAERLHKERKGITTLLDSVKQVCHKYIRERDKGKPCISCGTPWHDEFEAGHYFKSELHSITRFDEDNIHGQCVRCNRMNEGNLSQYTVNLPKRIGQERWEYLQEQVRIEKQSGPKKWDREKLKEIRTYYREKLKTL